MKIIKLATLAIATTLCFSASASASDWLTQRKFKSEVKAMKSAGKIPLSMKCRADPKKRVFKPQIKVKWANNNTNRDWLISAYKGQLDFKPGPPEKANQWRRVNKIVLKAGAGGSKFRCSLFYHR